MKNFVTFGLFFLLFCFTANAQDIKQKVPSKDSNQQNKEWVQIKSGENEFSLSIPNNYAFYFSKDGFTRTRNIFDDTFVVFRNLRSITAYENGVSMWIESYDVRNGSDAFRLFVSGIRNANPPYKGYTFGKNKLIAQVINKDNYVRHIYQFHTEKRVYYMGVGSRVSNSSIMKRFLYSIKFDGKYLFRSGNVIQDEFTSPSKSLSYENLQMSDLQVLHEKEDIKQNKVKKSNDANKPKKKKGDFGIYILSKPLPGYSNKARKKNTKGTVKLEADFGVDGLIHKIKVIQPLKNGLTERAINAARRIKFLPPTKDGVPYSITKTVVYNFGTK